MMSGKWFMVRAGRVWHYTNEDEGPRRYLNRQRGRVALCGVVDDGEGMGRVNAPDCVACVRPHSAIGQDRQPQREKP